MIIPIKPTLLPLSLLCLALPVTGELISSYSFTADSVFADGSGNGRDAQVIGGTMTGSTVDATRGDVFSLVGGAGFEDNPGTYLELPVTDTETGSWSLTMWLNDGGGDVQSYLFDNRDFVGSAGGVNRLIFSTQHNTPDGKLSVFCNGDWAVGSAGVNDGTWHHIAWVFDGTTDTMTIYVDGEQSSVPTTSADLLAAASVRLGNRDGDGAGGQNRLIDDVYIYNNALTAQEVTDLIAATTVLPVVPKPFQITSIESDLGEGRVDLIWNSGGRGPNFDVLGTDDLTAPLDEWTVAATGIPNDGETTSVQLSGISGERRFFIVRETPEPDPN